MSFPVSFRGQVFPSPLLHHPGQSSKIPESVIFPRFSPLRFRICASLLQWSITPVPSWLLGPNCAHQDSLLPVFPVFIPSELYGTLSNLHFLFFFAADAAGLYPLSVTISLRIALGRFPLNSTLFCFSARRFRSHQNTTVPFATVTWQPSPRFFLGILLFGFARADYEIPGRLGETPSLRPL